MVCALAAGAANANIAIMVRAVRKNPLTCISNVLSRGMLHANCAGVDGFLPLGDGRQSPGNVLAQECCLREGGQRILQLCPREGKEVSS